ncbi:MAG: AAA family ATPase [Rubritalea sp.]|jgi:MoxR-like ATPase|tara:strand:+ start:6698 stop:7609 length:912 start_codon:yes stop_codon:yes gene_type:complete
MPVDKLKLLHQRLTEKVLGAEQPATLLLIALLAKGHALIQGAPGIGKTSIAQTLASCFGGEFRRIQFTPDLLPSDILGYHLYKQNSGEFEFIPGPVFSNLLLADEINRTSPRVQAALLEAMNEAQVTIDGKTIALDSPFCVIATQNDTSSTGTFPLPEPQLDRFLLSIPMSLPSRSIQESIILSQHAQIVAGEVEPFLSIEDIVNEQEKCLAIQLSETLSGYIIALCESVRQLAANPHAVSIRGSIALLHAAQAYAHLQESEYVLPDHVQFVFPHVMRHRIICDDGSDPEHIIEQALQQTVVA